MQTFLPYPDFEASAKALDKRRLFKQVIEARQILASLGCDIRKNDGTPYKETHKNHPAILMWKGYTNALKLYHNVMLRETLSRGVKTQMTYLPIQGVVNMPYWLGDPEFHESHRSNLVRKDDDYYGKSIGHDLPLVYIPYVWPKSYEKQLTLS